MAMKLLVEMDVSRIILCLTARTCRPSFPHSGLLILPTISVQQVDLRGRWFIDWAVCFIGQITCYKVSDVSLPPNYLFPWTLPVLIQVQTEKQRPQ